MDDRTAIADRLAVLAQAITDAAAADSDGLSPSAVAALISLKNRGPLSIGAVALLAGLTHSAAVRLVDRLEKDWLVRRQRRAGREVMVELTSRGRRRAGQLQDRRIAVAAGFLDHLAEEDVAALDGLVTRLLARTVRDGARPDHLFRMSRTGAEDLDGAAVPAGE